MFLNVVIGIWSMGYLLVSRINSIEDMVDRISEEKISHYLPVEYVDKEELLLKRPKNYNPYPLALIKIRERRMKKVEKIDSLDLVIAKPVDNGFHYSKQNISEEFRKTVTDFLGGIKIEYNKKTWEYFGYVNIVLQQVNGVLNYLILDSSNNKYDVEYLKNMMKERFGITKFAKEFV